MVRGRGSARFRSVALGEPGVHRFRTDIADPSSAIEAYMYRDCSLVHLLDEKRTLRTVHDLLGCLGRKGFTLSAGLELDAQRDCILRHGPSGPMTWDDLGAGADSGFDLFARRVAGSIDRLSKFVHGVVAHRRDSSIRGWRRIAYWRTHFHTLKKWLRPDLVPTSSFLSCDPGLTPGGSGFLVDPDKIDEQLRKACLPFFCRGAKGNADLEAFRMIAEESTPHLDVVDTLTLLVICSVTVCKRKSQLLLFWMAGAGGSLKPFQLFGLTSLQNRVWPEALLDAFVAKIPKVAGEHFGLWASVRLQQLQSWFKSWVPRSVCTAGGGRSSVEAWCSTALVIAESLSGALDSDVYIFVAVRLTGVFLTMFSAVWGFLLSFGMPYVQCHAHVRRRFKLSCGLWQSFTRNGGIPQGCPLSMDVIVAQSLPWCRHLESFRGVKPQLYADKLKCVSGDDDDLLAAAGFCDGFFRLVGQALAPRTCALLGTSWVVEGLI